MTMQEVASHEDLYSEALQSQEEHDQSEINLLAVDSTVAEEDAQVPASSLTVSLRE